MGGGGGAYYSGLNDLYSKQAANADVLAGESKKTFADLDRLRGQAQDYGSLANQNKMAGQARADAESSFGHTLNDLDTNLSSYGIDPSQQSSVRAKTNMGLKAYAGGASGMTNARNQVQNRGFAMNSDVTNMGLGLPGQATSALSGAGNTLSNAGSMANTANANEAAGLGGITRGGIDLYGLMRANGGLITPVHRFEGGGFVYHGGGLSQAPTGYGVGGSVGAMKNMQVAPPPSGGGASAPAQVAMNGISGAAGLNRLKATGAVDKALGAGGSSNAALDAGMNVYPTTAEAAAPAADIVGAPAAAAVAEGGTEMALADLLPLLLAANGGHIHPMSDHPKNGIHGGAVHGKGGPKDDLIPAMLSNGEFVMPVGTVKKYGLDKLEKMRQDGLAFEKHLGIRSHA
jgi:hypothetical protein